MNNNKLTLWYEVGKREEVKSEVKKNIQQHYSFSDSEFESIDDGFKFLFDDETNGEIAIRFNEEKNALAVTVEGTWSWEVIEIYNHCLPQSAEHDPV
ncbi:hypothetical protein [Paenibacillus campinasensis]|uniref:Uncharacterized protein n=1 Tax=Paenibacillus campinasensis TaxID=66347 RepID=A0A268EIE1_9BACL|nr:hypothetical protein [Paenibacillus campinasensis]PAD72844.1 hypothetical protein CHH67_21290 [Paenibacillus campinasensis]